MADAQGKKFDFGNFTAGEKIKFYLTDSKGLYQDFILTPKNDNLTYLNFYDSNGRSEIDLKVHFTEGEYSGDTAPSGQPLPGTLATLLISSATIGILLLRKKRQALRAA